MRWMIRLLGLVVTLVAVAVGALVLIPADRIAALVAGQFQQATGRQMVIAGGVHPTLWPELGVRTGAVTIANAPWSKAGPMVQAEGLRVGVDPLALLGGRVKVGRVDLLRPRILLERGKDGRGNWQMAAPSTAPGAAGTQPAQGGGAGAPRLVSIDRATISDGAVTWIDDAGGTTRTLEGIDATFTLPDPAGAADLGLKARVNGQPFALALHLARTAAALAGAPADLTLSLTAGGSTIAFTGTADPAKASVSGALDANLADLPALFAAAGLSAPRLPQGLGARSIAARGNLTAGADGRATLAQATLTLDSNTLTGQIGLATAGARPKVTAILSAGKLDLAALGGGTGGGAGASGASGGGWSKAPIDVSALRAVDADVTLSAAGVDLGTADLGQTDVALSLAGGKATLALKQIAAYQGTISGQILADATGTPAVSADLTADKVALQPLLTAFANYTRLSGTGRLTASLQSRGGSMDALMNALAGSGEIRLGQGALQGFDLAGMLTHLDPGYVGSGARTIYDAITATFTITGGVLSNSDLQFKSALVNATGKGTFDIGGRTLDYTVTPVALQGIAGNTGVQVPLKISGPWAAPKFGLDLNAATNGKLDAEKKKLEDKAKAAAEKALGLPAGSGTDTRTLQDAAKQGLMKLLGGN